MRLNDISEHAELKRILCDMPVGCRLLGRSPTLGIISLALHTLKKPRCGSSLVPVSLGRKLRMAYITRARIHQMQPCIGSPTYTNAFFFPPVQLLDGEAHCAQSIVYSWRITCFEHRCNTVLVANKLRIEPQFAPGMQDSRSKTWKW